MTVARRIIVFAAGIALIILGLAGHHVEIGALIIGLVLIGALSGEQLAELIRRARRRDGR
jgi:hypothetical protein